jgi:hypothetical protein
MADAVSCTAILVSNGRLSERSTKTYKECGNAVLVPGFLRRNTGETMIELSQDSRRFSRHSKNRNSDYKPEPLIIDPASLVIHCMLQLSEVGDGPTPFRRSVCFLCKPFADKSISSVEHYRTYFLRSLLQKQVWL